MLTNSIIDDLGVTNSSNYFTNPSISIDCVNSFTYLKNERWYGRFKEYQLNTALQPIFSLAHQRIVGYEALIRIRDDLNRTINPSLLFNSKLEKHDLTLLDRISRMIHVKNYALSEDSLNWLFLNVSPQVVVNGKRFGSYFKNLLRETGFPPHRVVLEIVEHTNSNPMLLQNTVNYYKKLGCLIAIDDFGSGQSNFERIWSLNPDIVKLDRSMINRASEQKEIRLLLPGIVSLLHQAAALVLIEGIETEDQATIALECDADFVQGFYFSKPVINLSELRSSEKTFTDLFAQYKKQTTLQSKKSFYLLEKYKKAFYKVINHLESGQPIAEACQELLADSSVVRSYLLKPDGIQVDETVHAKTDENCDDIRYKPIQSARSADWFRRHYLQRAVFHPNQLQITKPYLSITGAHMCITISMLFETDLGSRVFCCDINWKGG